MVVVLIVIIFASGCVAGYAYAMWEHRLQQWNIVYSWLQIAADVVRGPAQAWPVQASMGAVPVSALLWMFLKKSNPALEM
jgi:hypothetical protein